jgi:hypothetical protein
MAGALLGHNDLESFFDIGLALEMLLNPHIFVLVVLVMMILVFKFGTFTENFQAISCDFQGDFRA